MRFPFRCCKYNYLPSKFTANYISNLPRYYIVDIRKFSTIDEDDNKLKRELLSTGSLWSWIPPRDNNERSDDETIPVIKKQLFSTEELKYSLEKQGAEKIVVINLNPPMQNIKDFIIVSGLSIRHLRKMGESIVRALKARELIGAPGYTGVEGDMDDDWLLVDCENIIVHLMLPEKRVMLDLETHWSSSERPCIPTCSSNKNYDNDFDNMLEKYPLPENFNVPEITDKNNIPTRRTDKIKINPRNVIQF